MNKRYLTLVLVAMITSWAMPYAQAAERSPQARPAKDESPRLELVSKASLEELRHQLALETQRLANPRSELFRFGEELWQLDELGTQN